MVMPSSATRPNKTARDTTNMPANTALPTAAPLPIAALVIRQVSTSDSTTRTSHTNSATGLPDGRKSRIYADGSSIQAVIADAQLLATT